MSALPSPRVRATLQRGLAVASTLAAGCIVYDPALVERDAGIDVFGEIDAPPVGSRQPPPRPPGPDDGTDIGEVAFGLRMVVLQQRGGAWMDIGYDLDHRHTVPPDNDSECRTPSGGAPPADGNDGIDNVFGAQLYPIVEASVPGLEEAARGAFEVGLGLPVLRITGWNGEPNDPRIHVVITTTVVTTSAQGPADGPPMIEVVRPGEVRIDSMPPPAPRWDGNDWAWVRSDSYVGGDLSRPQIEDDNGYVANGTIVARLPTGLDITFLFPGMGLGVLVRLSDAIATGQLDANGNLDPVVVAGRWSLADLLSAAEHVGICRGTPQYRIFEDQLNRIADVRREPTRPGDPVLDCNAVSLGVTFLGTRFRVAGLLEAAPVLNRCAHDAGIADHDAGSRLDAFAHDAPTLDAND